MEFSETLSKQPFTFSIQLLLSKKTIYYVLIAHKIFFNLNAIQIARCCILFEILKNLKTFRNSLRNCIETLRENDNVIGSHRSMKSCEVLQPRAVAMYERSRFPFYP